MQYRVTISCEHRILINTNIKTIHYVAPQVWVWREGRVKKFKKFLDHILLLFDFEKEYFDKENILFRILQSFIFYNHFVVI